MNDEREVRDADTASSHERAPAEKTAPARGLSSPPMQDRPCDSCGRAAHYILEDEREGVFIRCRSCGPPASLPIPIDCSYCCSHCSGPEDLYTWGGAARHARIYYSGDFARRVAAHPGWTVLRRRAGNARYHHDPLLVLARDLHSRATDGPTS